MLRVENLSFSYGKIRAVTDVSFEINAGEIFAIFPYEMHFGDLPAAKGEHLFRK